MNVDYNIIRREGERLIKYKLNVNDTKHWFCYKYKGLYYSFIIFRGELIDRNDRQIINPFIEGRKQKGKYFNDYYNSSLNQYYKQNQL